jgi:hypothetical protein
VSKLVDYPDKTPQFDSIFEAFAAINNYTQSEDCLTLNIWSKQDSSRLKPVYVHFYGGRMFLLCSTAWLGVDHVFFISAHSSDL